jgi:hypothetical protein
MLGGPWSHWEEPPPFAAQSRPRERVDWSCLSTRYATIALDLDLDQQGDRVWERKTESRPRERGDLLEDRSGYCVLLTLPLPVPERHHEGASHLVHLRRREETGRLVHCQDAACWGLCIARVGTRTCWTLGPERRGRVVHARPTICWSKEGARRQDLRERTLGSPESAREMQGREWTSGGGERVEEGRVESRESWLTRLWASLRERWLRESKWRRRKP